MKLSYLGHNGFIIEFGGKKLVIDPFITGNPITEGKIDPKSIKADYILLTHAHGDHISDVELIAKHNQCTLISNFEITSYYGKKGIKHHPLNHGGKFKFDFGTVKMVNAIHSSTFPDNEPGGNPAGFVIWNEKECLYIAGDTALTWDMKLIPLTCPPLTAAILPIGDNFTMGYEDACIAADFIGCEEIIAAHYDTFGYIVVNHDAAQKHFQTKGKNLHFIEIGKDLVI